jgi:hypothetical protein
MPRPRSTDQLISPEFLALKHRLDELIHSPSETEEKLHLIKLTQAGDEVE